MPAADGDKSRYEEAAPVARPGVASPAVVSFCRTVLLGAVRLAHRATLEGVENLPRSGPYLLVANHSGGLGIAEIHSFVALYAERFGESRGIAGFAHPVGFHVWPLSWLLRCVGAIPSTYGAARAALGAGVPLLVFPGGDHEAMRPLLQAYRVDFAGRKGFLRIAREMRVPIVPMGIRGSHFTSPILVRSTWLAWFFVWPRAVRVRRIGLSLLGVLGAVAVLVWLPIAWPWRAILAWLWAGSPLSFVPWVPWSIRIRIGAPIAPDALFGPADAPLDAALASVEGAVQSLVRTAGAIER